MTNDPEHEPEKRDAAKSGEPANALAHELGRLPGLAAIALYMLFLAGTVIVGVVGGHFPATYLLFPVLFIAAGLGLVMLFRWAWALALGAVVMLAALFFYQFATLHAASAMVQGLLNLVFFLYLVRAEVRLRLR